MIGWFFDLPWQHQILVGEALVSMALAILFLQEGHATTKEEHIFWAAWDAASIALLFWGGFHLNLWHIAYLAMMLWAGWRNIRRAYTGKFYDTKPVKMNVLIVLLIASIAAVQTICLVVGTRS